MRWMLATGLVLLSGCQCGPILALEDAGAPDGGDTSDSTADAGAHDAGAHDADAHDTGEADGRMRDAGLDDAGFVNPGDAGADPDAGTCDGTLWAPPLGCTAEDLEGKLACIPNLRATRAATSPAGYTRYDLVLTQPVDHAQPDGGTFKQRATLLFASADAPVVLSTSGYFLSSSVRELTSAFGANQLSYEHRYFAPSRPVPTDWSHLTIKQAADDAHELVRALRWVFPGRWVNTGASKGGMTSVYHRRFHPCDVDSTVAYVAPVSSSTADPAYGPFIASVGGAVWTGCRAELTRFQRQVLEARATLRAQLPQGAFTHVGGADQALELAVVELPFAFWQYTPPDDPDHGCAAIPSASATAQELLDFLEYHSDPVSLAGDVALAAFAPYYYQAATQLGGPAPYEAPLSGLLAYPGLDVAQTFAPAGVASAFDAAAMPDIHDWLDRHGERVLLLYGAFDPWSARPIPLGAARDSYTYIVEGGNHGARLGLLSPADKEAALVTLERWLQRPRQRTLNLLSTAGEDEPRVPR